MSEYEELDAQLRRWIAEDEVVALPLADHAPVVADFIDEWSAFELHVTPRRILADIAGKLALLDHVAGWPHEYVDGDTWFSCSQAVLPDNDEPGSGCADEKRAGKPCDCGLDGRRLAVLRCVAAGYVERDGFKDTWRLA